MVNAFRRIIFVIGLAVVIGGILVTSAQDPIIKITSPSDGDTVYKKTITVLGSAMGTGGAVVESVTVNGKLADGTTTWSVDISLEPGLNEITAVAKDNYDNPAEATIFVRLDDSTPTPTTTTLPNGGHRPTPIPTPTGSISITTIPSGAEVYWDGSFAGNTTITLTLEDVVGPHKVKISKDGFHSLPKNINLYKDITIQRNFELKPITGSISVSSTPSGASVYLDNVYMKANTTCMLSEVVVGQHTIKLTKSDYFDVTRNVSVSVGRTSNSHGNLTGYGSITISSNPSGAKVYLDGNYTRETPENINKVVQGNHTIKLTKSGYFNVTENVSVSVGGTHAVHENLTECGSLYILSNPPGANVFVDGNYMGKTPKGISTVALGNHTIKLTKSDYFNVTENVSVSVGETHYLNENLTGYGSFRISSNPSKAKVYLDDVFKGITPLDIDEVVEGSYFIKLTKFWYVAVEKKIDVSAGIKTPVNETLSVSPWWTLFAMLVVFALEEATFGFITKRIKPIIRRKLKKWYVFSGDSVPGDEKGYVFSWDSVPGDDDEKFKKTLRDDFDIGWAENVEIIKSDDGKTISISKDNNSAEIIIDEKKEKAILKICRTLDLKVKEENGKLNIYKKRK